MMLVISRIFLATLAASLCACGGDSGHSPENDEVPQAPGPDPSGFSCDASTGPTPSPLRRLSREQYINTVRNLVDDDAASLAVQPTLDRVPADSSLTDYATEDQQVTQAHTEAYWEVASAVAAELTTPSRLTTTAGECATDSDGSNDAACVESFVSSFGERALRRPLTDEERSFYAADAYGSTGDVSPASFADRIVSLLQSPQFLFRIEDARAASDDDDDLFPLDGYELASRLSFHFWQSSPDDALLAAAGDGSLETEDGYAAQVRRLAADARTERALDALVTGWLQLDQVASFTGLDQNAQFSAFAGNVTPTATLHEEMVEEVRSMFRHYAREGSLGDVLLSNRSFATTPALADIYGVEVWDGEAEPPMFDSKEQGGLFTRAAFVAAASTRSHPILRGVKIRRRVLCDELPPPPANAGMEQPSPTDIVTTREWVENKTEQPGTSCTACHGFINPPGFVLEQFDALGRFRTEESIYDLDGTLLATLPIDTSAQPKITEDDDAIISSAAELSQTVADSERAHACLARHYFRFAHGRAEDRQADGCQLRAMRDTLVEGSIAEMLEEIALRPEFKQRRRTP